MYIDSYWIDHADYEYERIFWVLFEVKEKVQEITFFN